MQKRNLTYLEIENNVEEKESMQNKIHQNLMNTKLSQSLSEYQILSIEKLKLSEISLCCVFCFLSSEQKIYQ